MQPQRIGIALVGNCVVDELAPVISPGQLSYTDANRFVDNSELAGEDVQYSTGGMALNVAVDLAKIMGGYPLTVIGKVGKDQRAELVRQQLQAHGMSTASLIVDPQNVTSCTEVLHIRMPDGSIERIFRHALGAMGNFSAADVNFAALASHKIVMFGYGLLLPQFDLADDTHGTVMGRCLAKAQSLGLCTALDFVSPTHDNLWKFLRYRKSLQYVDVCCINEDQAGALTDEDHPERACRSLVQKLHTRIAVVHCGAQGPNYAFSEKDGLFIQPNFLVAENAYKGNTGAGDAFSAGFLHSLHQNWPLPTCLKFAAAAAAISLADVSATGAMKSEAEIIDYMEKTPLCE